MIRVIAGARSRLIFGFFFKKSLKISNKNANRGPCRLLQKTIFQKGVEIGYFRPGPGPTLMLQLKHFSTALDHDVKNVFVFITGSMCFKKNTHLNKTLIQATNHNYVYICNTREIKDSSCQMRTTRSSYARVYDCKAR